MSEYIQDRFSGPTISERFESTSFPVPNVRISEIFKVIPVSEIFDEATISQRFHENPTT